MREVWMLVFFIRFLLILGSVCYGQDKDHKFVDGEGTKIDQGEPFRIRGPWSDKIKEELIGGKVTKWIKIKEGFGDNFPLTSWLRYPINNTLAFKKMGSEIAIQCKRQFPSDVMRTLSCVAKSVNATFQSTKFPSFFSACRSHSTAFRAAFNALNIPRASVYDISASTFEGNPVLKNPGDDDQQDHVVSRMVLTAVDGQTYSYVIDVGNKPETIYSNSHLTTKWHKVNKGYPEISFSRQPTYEFQPAAHNQ